MRIRTLAVLMYTLVAGLALAAWSHIVSAASESRELVNVPAAAGSLGPRLSQGDNGTLVLSWLEPSVDGHALRYSRWASDGWQVPETVTSGADWFVNWADFPSVVPITESFWVAHWLVRRAAGGYAYDVYVAVSDNAGITWHEGFLLHDDNTDTEHGFVSVVADNGAAQFVWLDGRRTIEPGGGMTLRTATLTADGALSNQLQLDEFICDCCQTDAVMTSRGLLAAYRDRTVDEIRDIYVTARTEHEWQAGEAVATDGWEINGCPVNGPALASNNSEIAVAWFTAANDKPRVRLARQTETDGRFGGALDVIDGHTDGRVGVVLLQDGTAVVSAIARKSGDTARLVLVRVDSDGRRNDADVVTNEIFPFSVPQLVQQGDTLISAWTIKKDDLTYIRSAMIPLTQPALSRPQ